MSRLVLMLVAVLCVPSPLTADDHPPDILGKLPVQTQTITVFGQRTVYYESGRGKTVLLLCNLGWDSNA